jgi:hypothetical protein
MNKKDQGSEVSDHDILSQLETSVDEQQSSQTVAAEQTNGRTIMPDNEVANPFSTKKREHDEVVDKPSEKSVWGFPRSPERELKKTRLDPVSPIAIPTTDETNANEDRRMSDPELPNAATTDLILDEEGPKREQLPSRVPAPTLTRDSLKVDESDSSDSEIPMIDTGFDTDEDEELE